MRATVYLKTDRSLNFNIAEFPESFLAVNQSENHNEQRDGFAKTDDGDVLTEALTGFRQRI